MPKLRYRPLRTPQVTGFSSRRAIHNIFRVSTEMARKRPLLLLTLVVAQVLGATAETRDIACLIKPGTITTVNTSAVSSRTAKRLATLQIVGGTIGARQLDSSHSALHTQASSEVRLDGRQLVDVRYRTDVPFTRPMTVRF
jgi:hypothetical protein